MRTRVLAIAVTLPLLLAVGVGAMIFTRRVSEEGRRMVEQIETDMAAGEPDAALETALSLREKWKGWEPLLELWVYHSDTDEVRKKLLLIVSALNNGDRSVTLENTALLSEALEHLHHRDDVTLSNVF